MKTLGRTSSLASGTDSYALPDVCGHGTSNYRPKVLPSHKAVPLAHEDDGPEVFSYLEVGLMFHAVADSMGLRSHKAVLFSMKAMGRKSFLTLRLASCSMR